MIGAVEDDDSAADERDPSHSRTIAPRPEVPLDPDLELEISLHLPRDARGIVFAHLGAIRSCRVAGTVIVSVVRSPLIWQSPSGSMARPHPAISRAENLLPGRSGRDSPNCRPAAPRHSDRSRSCGAGPVIAAVPLCDATAMPERSLPSSSRFPPLRSAAVFFPEREPEKR